MKTRKSDELVRRAKKWVDPLLHPYLFSRQTKAQFDGMAKQSQNAGKYPAAARSSRNTRRTE